ncbi:MAG: hypothetical protein NVSMB45_08730 [Ginsengibacter sp.]
MKKIFTILICFSAAASYSQTYDEWFQQQKTQKKYLLEQIAALHTYIGFAQKGYAVVSGGINTIRDLRKGDFSMHNNFFNSLTAVNPKIKKYVKVAAIIAAQISIAKQVHHTLKICRNTQQLSGTELKYLKQVFNNLLDECAGNLDELFGLVTSGEQQMKDDERIKRIDRLYDAMQDKQVFVQSFSHSAEGLSIQRRNEQYDIQIEKKLNGLQ